MTETVKELRKIRSTKRKEIWRRFRKNKLAMIGLVVIAVFVLAAVFADVIADYETQALQMSPNRLQTPSAQHLFGTDAVGRDIFARIVHGARVSLSIGVAVTVLSLIIGGFLGAVAAYFGGIVDNIIMRIMDILMCIPAILLALAIIAALGTSIPNLLIAITIAAVPGFARIVRAVVLTVVGQDYIEAARSSGMTAMGIIVTHVLPNAVGPIIVQATMSVASLVLAAAGLSYIGMGVQPPQPEWGAMLSDASKHMRYYTHLVIFPGIAIVLSALSLNLVGDGLRDALDPRLK